MYNTQAANHYNNQCRMIIERMLLGEKLTMRTAVATGIGDIRRRVIDLMEFHNVPVRREWAVIDGVKQRFKHYYIHPDDRAKVAREFRKQMEKECDNVTK